MCAVFKILTLVVFLYINYARADWAAIPIPDDSVKAITKEVQPPYVDSQKGKSPEFGHCYHFKRMDFYAVDWIEKDLEDAKWPDPVVIDDENIDRSQWIEIDSCARTMMSEIGTEPACLIGGKYLDYAVALARIIANRAQYVREHVNRKNDPIAAVLFPMKTAVEDKFQFSVWNAGAKVVDGAPCPSKKGANQAVFEEYVNLCKTAVVADGKRIRVRTPSMNDNMLFYTSGCKMHYQRLCERYTPLRAKIGPTTIQNYSCFEMWEDNHVALTEQQEHECIRRAEACCTPPSRGDRVIPERKDPCDAGASSWGRPGARLGGTSL